MLRSLSFSSDRNSTYSPRFRSGTPIQRIWRYLSTTELTGYRSELSLPTSQAVDDGHPLGLGNPKVSLFSYLLSNLCQLGTANLSKTRIFPRSSAKSLTTSLLPSYSPFAGFPSAGIISLAKNSAVACTPSPFVPLG